MSVQPIMKNYVTTGKLGSGTYGDVFKAYKKTGAREVVAIKCIQKKGVSKADADAIVGEISILKKLKHRHIVEMVDFFWDSGFIYIAMEYCGAGDLSKFIRAHQKLPERICRRFLQQLGDALQFLRSNDISHMDLKPQNILLSKSSPGGLVLKLADFGFAQHFRADETKNAIRGSPLYMAPEMVLTREYDARVDLWSVGVILYECLSGKAPYKSESLEELLLKIKTDAPIRITSEAIKASDSCHDLLSRCLQRDPAKRISFEEFFAHEFLDLEHKPSNESRSKALSLTEQAVDSDRAGQTEEALKAYRAALEYWVPIVEAEPRSSALRSKVSGYIERAEELKASLSGNLKPLKPEQAPDQASPLDCLAAMSSNTPPLRTAIEIAQSAECYDLEGQYPVAFEKYETALGMAIPLLTNEPRGERKTLLGQFVNRWMSRAESIKMFLDLQAKETSIGDSSLDRQCVVQ